MAPRTVMLDTNVFNDILSGKVAVSDLRQVSVVATHVQADELSRTQDQTRRTELLAAFSDLQPNIVPTETSIWGDSLWGETKWSSDDGVYDKLLARVTELDRTSGKRKRPLNQSRDARIGETALKLGVPLVTSDPALARAVREQGGVSMNLAELKHERP